MHYRAQFVNLFEHYLCLRRGQGVQPLGWQPLRPIEANAPRSLKLKARTCTTGAAASSRPCPANRRLAAVASRLAHRYDPAPRGKETPRPASAPPGSRLGAASLDTAKRRGVDRWRAPIHTGRTAAPTSPGGGAAHLRRRYAARPGGGVLMLPQGPAGQRLPRLHSLHVAARVKALRAAYGPLQRRTARARVDLLRLGAPGLRPPP